MPDSNNTVKRFRAGDSQAAGEIYERYVHRLVALARSRISTRLSRRVDAEDVVQSVYRSFFAHAQNGRFIFERSGDLWRLLSSITINKVLRQVQVHRRQKRDINRETQLVDSTGEAAQVEVAGEEPSPAEALIIIEELESVMADLSERHRAVLEQRLQGGSVGEIASRVNCSERTVRRVLERVRDILETRLLSSQTVAS